MQMTVMLPPLTKGSASRVTARRPKRSLNHLHQALLRCSLLWIPGLRVDIDSDTSTSMAHQFLHYFYVFSINNQHCCVRVSKGMPADPFCCCPNFLFTPFAFAFFPVRYLEPRANAATTFTVNSTADTPNNNLADGICNDGTDVCTLRAAIQQANSVSGADTITFNLSASSTITLNSVLLNITVTSRLRDPVRVY